MIAHVQGGQLVSISGNMAPGISVALPPTVGKATARRNQLAHVRTRAPAFAGGSLSASELLVRHSVVCLLLCRGVVLFPRVVVLDRIRWGT